MSRSGLNQCLARGSFPAAGTAAAPSLWRHAQRRRSQRTPCRHAARRGAARSTSRCQARREHGWPGLCLPKHFKDVRKECGLDALSSVVHRQHDRGALVTYIGANFATTRSELHGIGEEIQDHLLKPRRISHDVRQSWSRIGGEPDALGVCGRTDPSDGHVDQCCNIHGLPLQLNAAERNPGNVEEILHETRQRGAVAGNRFRRLQDLHGIVGDHSEHLCSPDDHVQRCAQLV